MKTEIRVCFDTSNIPGGAQSVLEPVRCGQDVTALVDLPMLRRLDAWVTLEEADPRVALLLRLLEQRGITWMEFHRDHYTEAELDGARLLFMQPTSECVSIDGGVEWGTEYDLSNACRACGSGGRQTSALFVDGEQLSELDGHRAGMTNHWHFLVDEGLAEELGRTRMSGLSFHGVYAVMPDKRQVKLRWRQICAKPTLPPLSPLTTGLERDDRDRACTVCQRMWYFETSKAPIRMVYRAVGLRDAVDVNFSWENQGFSIRNPEAGLLSYPWMLVTPKVRRVFRDAGVTSFDWLPVRVEDA